jgi:hypothetical protein
MVILTLVALAQMLLRSQTLPVTVLAPAEYHSSAMHCL